MGLIAVHNPNVKLLTNWTISETFNLYRGTRQECALSPLQIALALEPPVRNDPGMYRDYKVTTQNIHQTKSHCAQMIFGIT